MHGFRTLARMRDEVLRYRSRPGRREGTEILTLTGPLTLTTIFSFQDDFRAMRPQVMILDLSETPYMDSAGLGLVMNYYVSAQSQGRRLILAGANERIHALLEMTKVAQILTAAPTVEAAEQSL